MMDGSATGGDANNEMAGAVSTAVKKSIISQVSSFFQVEVVT